MNGIFITDASAVFADKLTLDDTIIKGGKFYFGKLEKDFEPIDDERYDLRCNRVLKYLVDKLDLSGFEKDEIGIVIGTTNSGIQEFEDSENKHHAELGNPAEFLKWYLGTKNYAASVSTACTSGTKAFSTAVKLLQNDVCKVEKSSVDDNKLVLTINRQPISEWFKEQWEKLRHGLRQSEEEPRKSRGFRM